MSPASFSAEEITLLFQRFKQLRLLVVGDLMIDRFLRGKVTRISPEAPVPVLHVTEEEAFPGGAANVARNLAACGVKTFICGTIGNDSAGRDLKKLMQADKINATSVVIHPSTPTVVKTRVIARSQQLVRVDRESAPVANARVTASLQKHLTTLIPKMDGVILEDYGKGLLTQELVQLIFDLAHRARVPVTVDPNPHNPLNWSGASAIKPNLSEACHVAGLAVNDSPEHLQEVARRLQKKWQTPLLLMTLGEHGMALFEKGKPFYLSPTKAREVFDVSGAGDTSIAFFTAALAAGLSARTATEIANHAAGIVVGKLGTATVTPEELARQFA
jgi:D-beta-D-heptose 7-phosphate kinase/D-beta-D-heptose 1-phosphate adenosyltransferase